MNLMQNKDLALPIIRIGLSLVFIWFGLNQIIFFDDFLGYLPNFLLESDYASQIIIFNGIFETLLGFLLIIGIFIRPVTFILAIHLIGIIISLGYNDISIRDFGLLMATIGIFLGGNDKWCIARKK